MRLFPAFLIIAPLLTGCASLTQEECATGDWSNIGLADATQGHAQSRLADHQKACKRYGIEPDEAKYLEGYRTGLAHYCTPTSGFKAGRDGYSYQNVCPAATEPEFMRGYLRGKVLHDIETQIIEVESRYRHLDREIDTARKAEDDKERRKTLQRLRDERRRLERERQRLAEERDRALLEADLFLQEINPDI
ncbi:DUF2799 domain-containing protein [uncultured Cohaesibacter sp.]|uniref:DUF2799 domain-containing protein n=1 Tax=uncultured Cohaesibacter sp. TaxID=1002546 RepID=UPI0029C8B62A|nr:DUF2799 domain-containing protein [uncultured Cohaesibacter sp.]